MSSAEEARAAEARRSRIGQRNPLAGRDTPVFTQMRRNPRGTGRQEFFTESTNTSYIPSPSPVRSSIAKPRQALSNGAAFKHNHHERNKENEPAKSTPITSQSRSQSRGSSSRRSPIHVSAQGSPQPQAREPLPDRGSARTPSPRGDERPPLISPASFCSESSEPPHALPEIYRQIEDEESLAGAGSDVSSGATGSPNNSRLKRLSLSPAGNRSSSTRRVSPPAQAQEKEVTFDLSLPQSPPLQSVHSEASSSFDETVETDPEMLARDERRVKEAIASDTRAFAKARKGNLTLENLRRQEASQGSKASSSSQSHSSAKSTELGLNVPFGWGGKAKKDKKWLESITKGRQPAAATASAEQANGESTTDPTKAAASVKDWLKDTTAGPIADAHEPVDELVAEAAGSHKPLRERTSFEKARQWENQRREETMSPPRTSAALAALRERSMERLEKSALTSNRLGALGDKWTLQKLARRTSGQSLGEARNSEASVPTSGPRAAERDDMEERSQQQSTASESQSTVRGIPRPFAHRTTSAPGIAKPDGPVSPEVAKQLAFAAASQPVDISDSRDLLRRFSRASSSSPVGASRTSQAGSSGSGGSDQRRASPLSFGDAKSKGLAKPSQIGSQGTTATQASVENSLDGIATDQSHKNVESHLRDGDFEAPETIAGNPVHHTGAYLETPKPVGAWVETPVATAKKLGMIPEDMSDPAEEYDGQLLLEAARKVLGTDKAQKVGPCLQQKSRRDIEALTQTAPELPRSALTAIIDHAKRKNSGEEGPESEETLQLDDSTIKSLEQLLVEDEKRLLDTVEEDGKRPLTKQPTSAGPAGLDRTRTKSTERKDAQDQTASGDVVSKTAKTTGSEPHEKIIVKDKPKHTDAVKEKPATSTKDKFVSFLTSMTGKSKSAKPAATNAEPKQTETSDVPPAPSTGDRLTSILTAVTELSSNTQRAVSDPGPRAHSSKQASKPALTVSIADSPKGTKAAAKKPKKSVAVIAPEESCDQAGEFHDFIWPCDACRRRAAALARSDFDDDQIGVVQWQTLQFPRLWTWPHLEHRHGQANDNPNWMPIPRLTKFGWFVLIASILYYIEMKLVEEMTPPPGIYAYHIPGWGKEYNMLRPPFVIPKLIWRGPAGDVVRWLWAYVCAIAKFMAEDVAGFDLTVPPPPTYTRTETKTWYDATTSYVHTMTRTYGGPAAVVTTKSKSWPDREPVFI